jgi:L-fuconolactonase
MIDAHQHFWRIGQNDCAWPGADLAPIHRDFEVADLEALARPLGIDGSVLVQSQPGDADTDYLLALAAEAHFVKGVVGWAHLKHPDAPARIAALAARPKLRGLRPMLQGLPEDDWILDPAVAPAIDAMIAHDLRFDALVFTRHLPHLCVFAARYPALQIVIDHAAKPPIASGEISAWAREIGAIAGLDNVWCKLSGLLTEMAPGQNPRAIAPYVDHIATCFGTERLMWGSDWPVLNLAGDYGGWLRLAGEVRAWKDEARDAVFGANAEKFYRL